MTTIFIALTLVLAAALAAAWIQNSNLRDELARAQTLITDRQTKLDEEKSLSSARLHTNAQLGSRVKTYEDMACELGAYLLRQEVKLAKMADAIIEMAEAVQSREKKNEMHKLAREFFLAYDDLSEVRATAQEYAITDPRCLHAALKGALRSHPALHIHQEHKQAANQENVT